MERSDHGIERALAGRWQEIPERIRRRINESRARRGLPMIGTAAPAVMPDTPIREPMIFWDPDSKHPLRRRFGGRWSRGVELVVRKTTRVVIAAAPGEAPAAYRDHGLPEIVKHDAFGTAAELNAARGWTLNRGHEGEALAMASPDRATLRAIDSDVGLLVEWIPDLSRADHRQVVDEIEAGHNAASVRRLDHDVRKHRLPYPTRVVLRATLAHLALLGPGRPTGAYPAARATVFRDCPTGEAELARQVAAVVSATKRIMRGR